MKRLNQKSQSPHKIALYIRVSTEEQASNPEGSIKSQEHRLRAHVDLKNMDGLVGEVTQVYVDRAKSGKDTKRSELQKLLAAIAAKEVTFVMVTEISRLSRSLKDFCQIWELMQRHGCQFQSLREQFDTSTAAGEMVLFTVANIAQFERRQISERVKANLLARAKRGLSNGGSIPLGYTHDPVQRGNLQIVEHEAVIVRAMFDALLQHGTLAGAGQALNQMRFNIPSKRRGGGACPRLSFFTCGGLNAVMKNLTYTGYRSYAEAGETKIVKAIWEPIIDRDTFYRAQAILAANYRRDKRNRANRYPYLLSGLVHCGECGDSMLGKSANGNSGKVPYYEHGWSIRKNAFNPDAKITCANPKRIQAKLVEPAVWQIAIDLLEDDRIAKDLWAAAQEAQNAHSSDAEFKRLRGRLDIIKRQLEATAEHLTKLPPEMSPMPIFEQMKKLELEKSELQAELNELSAYQTLNPPVEFSDYTSLLQKIRHGLDGADDALKARIVTTLIKGIEILPASIRVHYRMGKGDFSIDLKVLKRSEGMVLEVPPPSGRHRGKRGLQSGSNTACNGGPTWRRNSESVRRLNHDKI
jgi:site-specific DNA recombinase